MKGFNLTMYGTRELFITNTDPRHLERLVELFVSVCSGSNRFCIETPWEEFGDCGFFGDKLSFDCRRAMKLYHDGPALERAVDVEFSCPVTELWLREFQRKGSETPREWLARLRTEKRPRSLYDAAVRVLSSGLFLLRVHDVSFEHERDRSATEACLDFFRSEFKSAARSNESCMSWYTEFQKSFWGAYMKRS